MSSVTNWPHVDLAVVAEVAKYKLMMDSRGVEEPEIALKRTSMSDFAFRFLRAELLGVSFMKIRNDGTNTPRIGLCR